MSTTTEKPREWLTTQELAARWGIGYETLRRQVAEDKIPHLKVGGVRRISMVVVKRMEAHAIQGPEVRATADELVKSVREVRRSMRQPKVTEDFFPDL